MATPADTNLDINRIESADDARQEILTCRDIIDSVATVLALEADAEQEHPDSHPWAHRVVDHLQWTRPGLIKAIQAAVHRFDVAQETLARIERAAEAKRQPQGPRGVQ